MSTQKWKGGFASVNQFEAGFRALGLEINHFGSHTRYKEIIINLWMLNVVFEWTRGGVGSERFEMD